MHYFQTSMKNKNVPNFGVVRVVKVHSVVK